MAQLYRVWDIQLKNNGHLQAQKQHVLLGKFTLSSEVLNLLGLKTSFTFKIVDKYLKLIPGQVYHLYNRGNNSENLFIENRNHDYFLSLWQKHTCWVLDTYAYNLNDSYFHLLVQLKDEDWIKEIIGIVGSKLNISNFVSKQISNCFNAYSKSFNKVYNRTGSLFEERFKRKIITNDYYLKEVVCYIHNQGMIQNKWTEKQAFNSYDLLVSEEPTFLKREILMEKFGGLDGFIEQHMIYREFSTDMHQFLMETENH